jgi:hypothetical protein
MAARAERDALRDVLEIRTTRVVLALQPIHVDQHVFRGRFSGERGDRHD